MTSSTPDLVRVGVANGERISDLVLPSRLPLAEILPEVAAATGALDPYEVHGGYRIVTASGRALDPEVSLLAQGVHDGAVLSLVAGVDLVEHKVYDDVVEAVADAVEDTGSGWTPQASRRTVLAVAGLLLALGALVLLLQPPTVTVGVVAGAAVLLLLLGCAVFARRLDDQAAAVITGVGASVFAVIGALAAARAVSFAVPLLASGVALLFTGIVATALLPRRGWTFMPAV
ncbi:MAG TPA: EsaB/YukD family protein, partial [Dermatophilaceae bacterium]|nr:EsaB/YukD family protein [Dermatophilaceae bacterium]